MPSAEDYLHDILGVAESTEKLLQSIDNSLSSIAENIAILAAVATGRQCNYCGGSLDDGNSHLHGGDFDGTYFDAKFENDAAADVNYDDREMED